jgi:hypothetical protein
LSQKALIDHLNKNIHELHSWSCTRRRFPPGPRGSCR